MRNLIFAINLTIDGCCDHTKGIVDEEMLEYHTQLVRDADLFVDLAGQFSNRFVRDLRRLANLVV